MSLCDCLFIVKTIITPFVSLKLNPLSFVCSLFLSSNHWTSPVRPKKKTFVKVLVIFDMEWFNILICSSVMLSRSEYYQSFFFKITKSLLHPTLVSVLLGSNNIYSYFPCLRVISIFVNPGRFIFPKGIDRIFALLSKASQNSVGAKWSKYLLL